MISNNRNNQFVFWIHFQVNIRKLKKNGLKCYSSCTFRFSKIINCVPNINDQIVKNGIMIVSRPSKSDEGLASLSQVRKFTDEFSATAFPSCSKGSSFISHNLMPSSEMTSDSYRVSKIPWVRPDKNKHLEITIRTFEMR